MQLRSEFGDATFQLVKMIFEAGLQFGTFMDVSSLQNCLLVLKAAELDVDCTELDLQLRQLHLELGFQRSFFICKM